MTDILPDRIIIENIQKLKLKFIFTVFLEQKARIYICYKYKCDCREYIEAF